MAQQHKSKTRNGITAPACYSMRGKTTSKRKGVSYTIGRVSVDRTGRVTLFCLQGNELCNFKRKRAQEVHTLSSTRVMIGNGRSVFLPNVSL